MLVIDENRSNFQKYHNKMKVNSNLYAIFRLYVCGKCGEL